MKYEDLLTIRDALLSALSMLQSSQEIDQINRKYFSAISGIFRKPEEYQPIIDEVRNAFSVAWEAVSIYEAEQNQTIAANAHVLYTEDVPF